MYINFSSQIIRTTMHAKLDGIMAMSGTQMLEMVMLSIPIDYNCKQRTKMEEDEEVSLQQGV